MTQQLFERRIRALTTKAHEELQVAQCDLQAPNTYTPAVVRLYGTLAALQEAYRLRAQHVIWELGVAQ